MESTALHALVPVQGVAVSEAGYASSERLQCWTLCQQPVSIQGCAPDRGKRASPLLPLLVGEFQLLPLSQRQQIHQTLVLILKEARPVCTAVTVATS